MNQTITTVKSLAKFTVSVLTTSANSYVNQHGETIDLTATKIFGPDFELVSSYNAGKWFHYSSNEVGSIEELSDLLVSLSAKHKSFVVRGVLREGVNHFGLVNKQKVQKEDNTPSFQSCESGVPWIMLDIDKIEVPEHLSLKENPLECLEYAVSCLPEYFHNASYHYQLSSSAGKGKADVIKVHLWFWLSSPVHDDIANAWGKQVNKQAGKAIVDTMVLQAVQPHYTASPQFLDSATDPFPTNRDGLVKKANDAVEFPEIVIEQASNAVKSKAEAGVTLLYKGDCSTKGLMYYAPFAAKLNDIGVTGLHSAIYNAAVVYALNFGPNNVDPVALKSILTSYALGIDFQKHKKYTPADAAFETLDAVIDLQLQNALNYAYTKIGNKDLSKSGNKVIPYYPHVALLSAKEGEKKLLEAIKRFFEEKIGDMAIKGGAGLGKSSKLRGWIAEVIEYGYTVEIYAPNHRLAREWCDGLGKEMGAANADSKGLQLIKGRDRKEMTENDAPVYLCGKLQIVEQLIAANQSVFPTLCMKLVPLSEKELKEEELLVEMGKQDKEKTVKGVKCEFYDACPYIQQFSGDWGARIFPHSYLSQPRTMLDSKKPDLVIIDESFYLSMLSGVQESDKEISLAEIKKSGWNSDLIDALTTAKVEQPLLKGLVDRFGGTLIAILANAESVTAEKMKATASLIGMNYEDQLKAIKSIPVKTRLNVFLSVLLAEVKTGRDESHGIVPTKTGFKLIYRKAMTRLDGIPILFIDADATPIVLEQFVSDFKFIEIPVKRNARFIQCYSSRNSYNSMKEPKNGEQKIADIQHLINRVELDGNKRVMVGGPQSITGNYKTEVPAKVYVNVGSSLEHFNNIRGVDAHKLKDAAIVISRNQPPIQAIEAIARALWFDSAEPLTLGVPEFAEADRGYTTTTGLQKSVKVQVHPDKRVQNIVELLRESETVQMIDRLRLVWGKLRKDVFILSNVPLNLPINHLLHWNEIISGQTKLSEAFDLAGKVLPLVPAWLATSMPQLFNKHMAENFLRTYRNDKAAFLNDLMTEEAHPVRMYEFKVDSSVSKRSKCLSAFGQVETKDRLKATFAKDVVYFKEIVD